MRPLPGIVIMTGRGGLQHGQAEPATGLQGQFHLIPVLAHRPARLSFALRIRYWAVFLCSINCPAVVLQIPRSAGRPAGSRAAGRGARCRRPGPPACRAPRLVAARRTRALLRSDRRDPPPPPPPPRGAP